MYFKHTVYQPQVNQDKDNANWLALQFAIALACGQRSVKVKTDVPITTTSAQSITIDTPQFIKYLMDAVTVGAIGGVIKYDGAVTIGDTTPAATFTFSDEGNTMTVTFTPTTTGTLSEVRVSATNFTLTQVIVEE